MTNAVARANPPWATRLLNENWKTILLEVKDPMWMPRKRAGSGKREFDELGCGHYGCVFSTLTPGIVFKISTDSSEVEFVKAAMQLGNWPTGIVRYQAVLDMEGSHRKRPVFVVWREEAFEVGSTKLLAHVGDPRAEKEWMRYHKAYRNAASAVRIMSLTPVFAVQLAEAKERHENWAWQNVIWEDGLDDPMNRIRDQHGTRPAPPAFMRHRGAKRIAAALRICGICFELMEHTNYAPDVGAALKFYLDNGILLADVHMQNIGKVTRDDGYGPEVRVVITDPGHAVFVGK